MAKPGRDMGNLVLRHRTYYAVREVPRDLRATMGRVRFVKTLGTDSHSTALRLRAGVLALFDAEIAKARGEIGATTETQRAALEWRRTLNAIARGDLSRMTHTHPSADDATVAEALIEDEADRIEHGESVLPLDGPVHHLRKPDPRAASEFRAIAHGQATPIKPLIEAWLAEADVSATSGRDHRFAFSELIAWTEREGVPLTIEAFDRRTCGRYVSHLLRGELSKATLNKRLWSPARFWVWLEQRGYRDGTNPWHGHEIGRKDGRKEPERAFTEDELRTLLTEAEKAPPIIRDMLHMALLTGCRAEELACLRVRDFDPVARTLAVTANPKTPASRRVVPLHPELASIVARRIDSKSPDSFLFQELRTQKANGRRSGAFVFQFSLWRDSIGLTVKQEGQRRSLINFHSCRRWFVTAAEQAGQPESVIRAVVGHKRPGVTLGVYSAGPSLAQKRACVESVQLPA